jgi:hypothetical protein
MLDHSVPLLLRRTAMEPEDAHERWMTARRLTGIFVMAPLLAA